MVNQKRETTSDRIFQLLSEEIINGHLKSQEKISEPALARRFGTSRAPVREAIRRMEERGLIVRKPHSGCRVAAFSMKKFLEIFEIRGHLEGLACRLVAERMSDEELARLRESLEKQLRIIQSDGEVSAERYDKSMDFHYIIAHGSGNAALARLLCDDFKDLINLYRKRYTWIGSNDTRTRSIREHMRILEALEERDGLFAETIMRRHIASAMDKIKENDQTNLLG